MPAPGSSNTSVLEGEKETLALPASITPGAISPKNCAYHVAPSGDDGNPGIEAQPWATFQQAAELAQAGDTVCFRGGTYALGEEIHLTQSGTADALITFIAYPGQTPILDGGGSAGGLLILDQHTSYLRISGFGLRGFSIWGMEFSGENRYVHLDHLDIEVNRESCSPSSAPMGPGRRQPSACSRR